ncbi:MAG: 4Fe-4S binding protein [Spirochaetales bacterium]|nr:4Fe-4S binding protein [Spirochaetales bacterium]
MRKHKFTWYTLLRTLVQFTYAGMLISGIIYQSYALLISFIVLTVLGGNFFCGWLCPFGTVQEWLGKLGSKLVKKKLKLPFKLHRTLSLFRYIIFGLLFFGFWYVYFVNDPYSTFQALLSGATAYLPLISFVVLGLFLVLSAFFERPFCTFLCSDGGQYGLLGMFRIFTIKRNSKKCNSCRICDSVCPSRVNISAYSQVRSAQCTNCFKCIKSCKTKKALIFGPVLPNIKELLLKVKLRNKPSESDAIEISAKNGTTDVLV